MSKHLILQTTDEYEDGSFGFQAKETTLKLNNLTPKDLTFKLEILQGAEEYSGDEVLSSDDPRVVLAFEDEGAYTTCTSVKGYEKGSLTMLVNSGERRMHGLERVLRRRKDRIAANRGIQLAAAAAAAERSHSRSESQVIP